MHHTPCTQRHTHSYTGTHKPTLAHRPTHWRTSSVMFRPRVHVPTMGADAGLPALTLHVHVVALAYAGTKAKGRPLPAPGAAAVPNTALAPAVDEMAATLTVEAAEQATGSTTSY
jgi:hypothetical protein